MFEEQRTRHAVFFALAQDFCYARHNEQAHSALAYSKKSLHWDLRCFSGGIVFIDVLRILDAALSRLFGLMTNRTLELSVPTLWNTHSRCVLFLTVYLLAGCLRVVY